MFSHKTLRAARNALAAYAPDTEHGRESLKALDAEGLAQLRALAKLSPVAHFLLHDAPMLLSALTHVLSLFAVCFGLYKGSASWIFGGTVVLVLELLMSRVLETWEPAVHRLKLHFLPVLRDAFICQQVRDLALSHHEARAYRDEVVRRRALVDADFLAMQALEQQTRREAWLRDWPAGEPARGVELARLGRQAHGEPVLD